MTRSAARHCAAAFVLTLALGPAAAQTAAPAKPAEGKTLSLGGSNAKGRLLSRDELRVCLQQQQAQATRRTELEAAFAQIETERTQLSAEDDALKIERGKLDAVRAAAADVNTRYKDYSDRVAAWNGRVAALQDRTGLGVDRERKELERERVELQKQQADLDADRAKVAGNLSMIDAFNKRASSLEARSNDWNQRNKTLTAAANAANVERENWMIDCAARRYREDDEAAIRRGQ